MGTGAEPGWGGDRGTCVYLHKNMRRNRLECRFGAEYLENTGRYRIFPSFYRIFFEGKILRIRGRNPVLSLITTVEQVCIWRGFESCLHITAISLLA